MGRGEGGGEERGWEGKRGGEERGWEGERGGEERGWEGERQKNNEEEYNVRGRRTMRVNRRRREEWRRRDGV